MRPRICVTGFVRPSFGQSVSWLVTPSSKTRKIDIFDQIDKKNHVITSSRNNSTSKRTHRWPYGPYSSSLSSSSNGNHLNVSIFYVFLNKRDGQTFKLTDGQIDWQTDGQTNKWTEPLLDIGYKGNSFSKNKARYTAIRSPLKTKKPKHHIHTNARTDGRTDRRMDGQMVG